MHNLGPTFMEMEGSNFEFNAEGEGEVFNEGELQEIASELLEVSNEQEFDHFLGDLIKKAGSAVGSFVKSPLGQQLGGMLKSAAGKLLPAAGAALGNALVPGIGGVVGGKLASMAGSAMGLELEGLSQEDREFEVAKQFVRLAADATKTAATSPAAATNPAAAARDGVAQAAQKFAPGLLSSQPSSPGSLPSGAAGSGGASGRWVRRGRKIVLYGV